MEHSAFGQAVARAGNESLVRVWGDCDCEQAWFLRDGLDDLVVKGPRRISLDVSELRFKEFTAVAILVGGLARIRQMGAEVTVSPPSSNAYRVLKRADLMSARALSMR